MEKIILDTDIGCDIDDAICLAYLLSRQDCELLGVTTVNGDTTLRAMLASAIIEASGKNVPVYPGTKDTLLLDRERKNVSEADCLPRIPHKTSFEEGKYLTFMRDAILSNPGEVTLLAIGPMTNVGLLFAAYPETAKSLKKLVLMGGNFMNPQIGIGYMESNTLCDPHASALVYRAPVEQHYSIGNDITFKLGMDKETVYNLFPKHPILKATLPMVDEYFKWSEPMLYFHDTCAAVSIFRPELAKYARGRVEVELSADALKGMTVFKHAAFLPARHYIARQIDTDVFFRDFFEVFGLDKTSLEII